MQVVGFLTARNPMRPLIAKKSPHQIPSPTISNPSPRLLLPEIRTILKKKKQNHF
jgi:hypothetical protein